MIGANAIGLETGQLFTHLGSRVTFLEAMPRITPLEEPEVSETMQSILEAQGATVLTGVKLAAVARQGNRRLLAFEQDGAKREIKVDDLVVATGRRPNTAGLGLEKGRHRDHRARRGQGR